MRRQRKRGVSKQKACGIRKKGVVDVKEKGRRNKIVKKVGGVAAFISLRPFTEMSLLPAFFAILKGR